MSMTRHVFEHSRNASQFAEDDDGWATTRRKNNRPSNTWRNKRDMVSSKHEHMETELLDDDHFDIKQMIEQEKQVVQRGARE